MKTNYSNLLVQAKDTIAVTIEKYVSNDIVFEDTESREEYLDGILNPLIIDCENVLDILDGKDNLSKSTRIEIYEELGDGDISVGIARIRAIYNQLCRLYAFIDCSWYIRDLKQFRMLIG